MNSELVVGIDASRANEDQKTGVGWYCFYLIEELKKLEMRNMKSGNVKFRFVLYSREPLKGDLAKLPEGLESKVLRWPPFGFSQGKPWRFWTQIRLSWEMLFHAPDVLFIPAHVFPIIHPKKTVMTVHDVASIRFPESYNRFERWYSVWSAKWAMKKLWKVIVPSEFTKSELKKFEMRYMKLGRTNVIVVPHGYDERFDSKNKILSLQAKSRPESGENKIKIGEVLKKYKIEKPFIMSIGRLERKKNTVSIVKAFNECRMKNVKYRMQLVLVGSDGYGFEDVRHEIEHSLFKNDIITPGWVDQEDVPYLMNSAEVFVFPSLYEGFGIPVLEAMACGTPVVASRGSCLEEVGGDAVLYVDPRNQEEIASAIVQILFDESMRSRLIARGLEQVQKFSWEQSARQTLSLLLDHSQQSDETMVS